MLFVFKGEAKIVLAYFISGLYICILSGEINALVMNTYGLSYTETTRFIAPILEEFLKSIPVFVFAYAFKPKRQILIHCAVAVGVGFALVENIRILINFSDSMNIIVCIYRGLGAALMHGISTLMYAALANYFISKAKYYILGLALSLVIACLYHGLYNYLISSQLQYLGIFVPVLTFILLLIFSKNQVKLLIKS